VESVRYVRYGNGMLTKSRVYAVCGMCDWCAIPLYVSGQLFGTKLRLFVDEDTDRQYIKL
jgi:hypothetical protein